MADKYVQLKDNNGNNLYPAVADFPLSVANGGTGASTASSALSNLGLEVKTLNITCSGTNLTFSDVYAYQVGKIVCYGFTVKTNVAINTGGGTQSFSITGLPTNIIVYSRSRSMSGSMTVDIYVSKTGGDCGVRNNGSTNISAGTSFSSCNFVYVAE